MKRWLLLILAFIPVIVWGDSTAAYATSTDAPIGLDLTPPTNDLSYYYLSNIFGIVDGVLHGTGSQIIGTMFGVFNAAVLALGSIIVMYILMVGTLNTAHQGEVLGQKWSSAWTPIKTVAGIGLMLPKASGYSYIQIFIMWVIVQGVGAADSVWNAALGYLQRGGVLVQSNTASTLTANSKLSYTVAGSLLRSEVCMFTLQNALTNVSANNANSKPPLPTFTVPSFSNTLQVAQGSSSSQRQLAFPGTVTVNGTPVGGACGTFTWTSSGDAGQAAVGNAANYGSVAADTRSIAVQQVMLDMMPIAQQIAAWIIPPPNSSVAAVTDSTTLQNNLESSYKGQIVGSVGDYMGIMGPELNSSGQSAASQKESIFNAAEQGGWILAGSYYFMLVSLNNSNTQTETTSFSNSLNTFTGGIFNTLPSSYTKVFNSMLGTGSLNCQSESVTSPVNNFICSEYTSITSGSGVPTGVLPKISFSKSSIGGGKIGSAISESVLGSMSSTSGSLNKLLTAQTQTSGTDSDPLVQIGNFGNSLLDIALGLWIGAVGSLATAAGLASVGACANPGFAVVLSVLLWFVPMLTVIICLLFTTGVMMAYYIPLIPFLIYLFAAIGWLAAVAEAMVAAPLVALGLAIPEGHEVMGKAEAALMLVVSVFMRPTLIVFGFLLGSIIAHVALWLLDQGFGLAVTLSQNVIKNTLTLFSYIAMIVVYTGMVISIINRSFAMIYEVPNRVLTWIGGTAQSFGEGHSAEEVKGQVSQFGEGVSKVAQGAITATQDALNKSLESGKGKEKKDSDKEEASAKDDDGGSGGQPPVDPSMMA